MLVKKEKVLILSSLFPPQNSSLSKRLYDLFYYFSNDSCVVLTGKENVESKSKTPKLHIPYYYFSGFFYKKILLRTNLHFAQNDNFIFYKIIRKFYSATFYISRLLEICFKVFYITRRENIKSVLSYNGFWSNKFCSLHSFFSV